jgi:hypothetical protein
MTRFIVVSNNEPIYDKLFHMVDIKQNGLCRLCKRKIDSIEDIVSSGSSSRKYYHVDCAKKINIIV